MLPLMRDLPRAELPTDEPLILASGSPRRAELLKAAGYDFAVQVASDEAESGTVRGETAAAMVRRFAYRKAADVAKKFDRGLIVAADTVASCSGQILGKPRDRDHAQAMLQTLSGRQHDVFTGICVWSVTQAKCVVDVVGTELMMDELSDEMLSGYLDTSLWEGKAGSFGYQDGNDWIQILNQGSESNVVGLPMERFAELLENFDSLAETINTGSTETSDKLI
ncbi:Maf-like protein YhdE [Rubripirellula obstinata]|uniref:dTTP/UTP pyrophosphatase n=2 Tax=Rubripirellula obstinata TaxID=406547 RepID=A0A5B1CHT5_9BACT|nr:Maf-like protein YhdE [Rubripirellula obstinata]